jgi:uncharacterized protein YeaO (DUF488 family)
VLTHHPESDIGVEMRRYVGIDLIKLLKRKAKEGTITLIYAARDEEHNEAVVLKQFLERLSKPDESRPL